MSNLEHALAYHAEGYNLIPVGKNKHPLIAEWKHFQTHPADESQIRHWWSLQPNANLAAICGRHSGFFVIDIDLGADISGLNLPPTKIVKTGSGGFHYYYKWQEALASIPNTVGIRPHVDIRGEGSYVLIPPSINEKGQYELIVDIEMADIFLNPVLFKTKKVGGWQERLKSTPLGQRNAGAAQLIGGLTKAIPPLYWEDTITPFIQWWNANRCSPPLPEVELMRIVNSIYERSLQTNWSSWIDTKK